MPGPAPDPAATPAGGAGASPTRALRLASMETSPGSDGGHPSSGPIKLDIDDYLALPDDGKRYEILDGRLYMSPAPRPRHQKVSRRLQLHLMLALEETGQGEVFNAPID